MARKHTNVASLTTIYAFGGVLAQLLPFALLPVYTAYLLPMDYGALALLALTVRLITRVASSPINQGLNRFYYKPDYAKKREELFSALLVILVLKTLILALLYWLLSNWLCTLLLGESSWVPIVRLYGFTIILIPIEDYIITFLRLRKMASYCVFLNFLKAIVYAAISVGLLVRFNLGVMAVAWGAIAGSLTLIIVALPAILRHMTWIFRPGIAASPLKYGYPLIITGYAGLLMQSGDRYILRMLGSLSDVGIYSFGYQFSGAFNNVYVMPVHNAASPKAFQLESEPVKQRQYLRSAATLYYALGLMLVLFASLFAKDLIKVLVQNSAFWPAWVIVPIITLSYLQEGLGNFFVWGMRMDQQTFNISKIAVYCGLLNIFVNILLIPFWGILGAAIATLVAYVVSNMLQLYKSSKAYSLHFDIKRILTLLSFAIIIFGVALLLASSTSYLLNIGIKLGLFFLYPYLLYLRPGLVFETNEQYQGFCKMLLNYKISRIIGRFLFKRSVTI